ncbi:MAG TPA: sugar kinase [Paracoccaceae bacterium]
MSRFIAIGECMIELTSANGPDLWRMGIAGDTLNTAWYARQLLGKAWSVDYLTRLGTDPFSDRIQRFLTASGIGTDHLSYDPIRSPGLYAVSLANGERSFTYWRGESAARGLADDPDRLTRACDGAAVVYVSGITLAILPLEGRATLLRVLATARENGALVAFDPNIRLRLWPSTDVARKEIAAAARVSSVVLPSFDDEASLFGDATPQATAARYAAWGVPEIVVKNAGGVVEWRADNLSGQITNLAQRVPVDTTGAGDSFNSGYLAARLQSRPAPEAIRHGHAIAVQVIGHPGALAPLDLTRIATP